MFNPHWRVLVVDDMKTMRKIVIKMLQSHGFSDFTEAADGVRAWEELIKAAPPIDFIVSDINMPNMNGLEFLKRCRADDRFKTIPFFFLTAEADLSTVKSAVDSEVTSYLLKPIIPAELDKKLKALPTKKAG